MAEQFVVGLVFTILDICRLNIYTFSFFKRIMQLVRNTQCKSNATINTTIKQTNKKTKRNDNQNKTAQKRMNTQGNYKQINIIERNMTNGSFCPGTALLISSKYKKV